MTCNLIDGGIFMEINKENLSKLLALDDDTLREKLLEIAALIGIKAEDAKNMTGDMSKARALLTMVSDDDLRRFLGGLKK